ncbi:peptidase M16 inactive domain-containing protein [Cryptosporidium muris RN66]|uniref:Peptidase M16 inactive domain-containing protein n=1 Tax=Cryptosporidium muris (strain RN66) TaxID=441375 RepID=B6AII6_CRYMR|nr:peptidase M16 inactive domain-containing protein [Cryptosporidium muris RN66]EEA08027.1 peptidase M16 inactive domain-containing protein [Cryptosporidium muris RN66]|eukprot:XP_002142376.1 peptidase M16 inactive domain-containing protein [Cryptosporidium muris RN66]
MNIIFIIYFTLILFCIPNIGIISEKLSNYKRNKRFAIIILSYVELGIEDDYKEDLVKVEKSENLELPNNSSLIINNYNKIYDNNSISDIWQIYSNINNTIKLKPFISKIVDSSKFEKCLNNGKYKLFVLNNSLKVILISSEKYKISDVSLGLTIGNSIELDGKQGLLSLLRHIIFKDGSSVNSSSSAFIDFIKNNNGHIYSHLYPFSMDYGFSIDSGYLEIALNMFSSYFESPKFDEEIIYSTLNNLKLFNITDYNSYDEYSAEQILKDLSNPNHIYYKLSNRNYSNLINNLKSRSSSTYYELINIYKKYYNADLMILCIVSNKSLDILQRYTMKYFSNISNSKEQVINLLDKYDSTIHPYDVLIGKIIQIKSRFKQSKLLLVFPIPNKVDYYLQYKLGDYLTTMFTITGGKYDLESTIINKGWAKKFKCKLINDKHGFSYYLITIILPKDGEYYIIKIIETIFSTIQMIKETNIDDEKWEKIRIITEVQNKKEDLNYKNNRISKKIIDTFIYTNCLPEDILKVTFCIKTSNIKEFYNFISYLNPRNMLIILFQFNLEKNGSEILLKNKTVKGLWDNISKTLTNIGYSIKDIFKKSDEKILKVTNNHYLGSEYILQTIPNKITNYLCNITSNIARNIFRIQIWDSNICIYKNNAKLYTQYILNQPYPITLYDALIIYLNQNEELIESNNTQYKNKTLEYIFKDKSFLLFRESQNNNSKFEYNKTINNSENFENIINISPINDFNSTSEYPININNKSLYNSEIENEIIKTNDIYISPFARTVYYMLGNLNNNFIYGKVGIYINNISLSLINRLLGSGNLVKWFTLSFLLQKAFLKSIDPSLQYYISIPEYPTLYHFFKMNFGIEFIIKGYTDSLPSIIDKLINNISKLPKNISRFNIFQARRELSDVINKFEIMSNNEICIENIYNILTNECLTVEKLVYESKNITYSEIIQFGTILIKYGDIYGLITGNCNPIQYNYYMNKIWISLGRNNKHYSINPLIILANNNTIDSNFGNCYNKVNNSSYEIEKYSITLDDFRRQQIINLNILPEEYHKIFILVKNTENNYPNEIYLQIQLGKINMKKIVFLSILTKLGFENAFIEMFKGNSHLMTLNIDPDIFAFTINVLNINIKSLIYSYKELIILLQKFYTTYFIDNSPLINNESFEEAKQDAISHLKTLDNENILFDLHYSQIIENKLPVNWNQIQIDYLENTSFNEFLELWKSFLTCSQIMVAVQNIKDFEEVNQNPKFVPNGFIKLSNKLGLSNLFKINSIDDM